MDTKQNPVKVLLALARSLHVLTLICNDFIGSVAKARQIEFSLILVNRKPLHYLNGIFILNKGALVLLRLMLILYETIFQKGLQLARYFAHFVEIKSGNRNLSEEKSNLASTYKYLQATYLFLYNNSLIVREYAFRIKTSIAGSSSRHFCETKFQ